MDDNTLFLSIIVLYFVYRLINTALKRRSEGGPISSPESPVSETELLRELHQGLARMEKRIEALETLLVERGEADRVTAGEKRP